MNNIEHFISTSGAEMPGDWSDPNDEVLQRLAADGNRYRPVSVAAGEGWGFPTDPDTGARAAIISAQFRKWSGRHRCVMMYEYYLGNMSLNGGSIELRKLKDDWTYIRHRSSYIG